MHGRLRGLGAVSLVAVLLGLAPAVGAEAQPLAPDPDSSDAFYSPSRNLSMARSPLSLRRFLSTDQTQYEEQSYVWAGSLIDYSGTTNAVAVEMQRNDVGVADLVRVPEVASAVLFNQGDDPGYAIGGLGGIAELTLPVSFTSSPWSVRAQSFTAGQQPDFIDARVVEGQIGRRGAVYEITTSVPNVASSAPAGERITTYIRAKDVTGIMQWGYGPSGFCPMWIFSGQRNQIMDKFDGSVGDYLTTTGDSMRGQGTYYFSMPLLQVQRFKVSMNGKVVSAGDKGWLWWDNVERSFDAQAQQIVDGGVSWLEFSVQIPDTGEALKIGYTKQESVGTFPYAMLASSSSPKAANGARTSLMNWNMQDIHVRPIKGSEWTNPATGNTYYLKYRVDLDASSTTKKATFFMSAAVRDQEAVVSGRSVFEGLFDMTGTIDGRKVSGWAFGELQPTGSL